MAHIIGLLVRTIAMVALLGAPGLAQLDGKQQRCANELSLSATRVAKVRWKQHLSCLKQIASGQFASSYEQCVAADGNGKLAKVLANNEARANDKCGAAPPSFGALGSATVADVTTSAVDRIMHEMFGRMESVDLLADSAGARCQANLVNAARKCHQAIIGSFAKCKKAALRGTENAPVTDSSGLRDACMGMWSGFPDPSGKIEAACAPGTRAISGAFDSCTEQGIGLASALHGFAAAYGPVRLSNNPNDAQQFLHQIERCESCQAINAAEGLTRDCDRLDNALLDLSCGNEPRRALHIEVVTSQQSYLVETVVDAVVHIETDFAFDGDLTVTALDETMPGAAILYEETIPLSLTAGASAEVPVSFPGSTAGSYTLHAGIPLGEVTFEANARFGVRPLQLADLPENILSADIETLDVSAIASALENGAADGVPITINLGGRSFRVQIQESNPFQLDPGETLPSSLSSARFYTGVVCGSGSGCSADEASQVALIVGSIEGASDTLYGRLATNDDEDIWVVPWARYHSPATLAEHALYNADDSIELPIEHGEPDDSHGLAPSARTLPGPSESRCPTGQSVTLTAKIKVFEDPIVSPAQDFRRFALRSIERASAVQIWTEVVKREFVFVRPRRHFSRMTVSDVVITAWKVLSPVPYVGTCGQILSAFTTDYPADGRSNNILFTEQGSDCGGMAHLGRNNPARQCSFTRDLGAAEVTAVTLGQEVGHNWDWHGDENDDRHDNHKDRCIGESWDHPHESGWVHRHSTIMGAGYLGGGQLTYWHTWRVPLEHLAEGICRLNAVPTPTPPGTATRTPTRTATPTRTPTATPTPLRPDLVVQSIDEIRVINGYCMVFYTLYNGDVAGAGASTTEIYIPQLGSVPYEQAAAPLAAWESRQDSISINQPSCDDLDITVIADSRNEVIESNENNNRRLTFCDLNGCGLPDLHIQSFDGTDGAPTGCTAYFTIENLGYSDTWFFYTWVHAYEGSSNTLRTFSSLTSPVIAGTSRQESVTLYDMPCSSLFSFEVLLDAESHVNEANENNNFGSAACQLSSCTPASRADLVVSSIDAVVPDGSGCALQYTLTNQGGTSAGGETTRVHIVAQPSNLISDYYVPMSPGQVWYPHQVRHETLPLSGGNCAANLDVTIRTDVYDAVFETDETNNIRQESCSPLGSCS